MAVARKLIERTWTVLTRQQPYQLRDVDQAPVTARAAKEIITSKYRVPEHVLAPSRYPRPGPLETDDAVALLAGLGRCEQRRWVARPRRTTAPAGR